MTQIPPDQGPDKPDTATPEEALKRRLLGRLAIAGGLVVVLLAGLAVMDHMSRAPEVEPPKVASASGPIEPAETPAEKPAESTGDATAVPEKGDAVTDSDTTSAPPLNDEHPAKPLTVPAEARTASMRPSPEASVPSRGPEPAQRIPQRSPVVADGHHAPASRPLTQPGPIAAQPAQVTEANRQFVVQMGVFNNIANAEELRAKLELAGIPAQIEARVKVGPFATREEAEAARKKLAALGLDPGYLTATRK